MSQMLKSSSAMGAATMLSRVLGLVREIVYASFMGTGWVADAFFFAFQVPNLFRRLLGEGALTAAFIPIFKEKEKLEGDAAMWRGANAVISGLVVSSAAVIVLGVAGISIALATGWIHDPQTSLMLELLRVMFPYILLVCLAAIFMGMLNARGHFFVPAMGATMLNLVMIASVLWLAPHLGSTPSEQIVALAYGVVAAGCAQAFFQLPLLNREGFRWKWVTPWRDDTVRRVVQQMLPATIGVAAFQINVLVTASLAFGDKGIVSSFNYAVRLMEFPQGIFGISLATYLLPALSGLAAEKKFPEFRATLGQGLGYLIFLNALASVLLCLLAEPMIRLLFERRSFDSASTGDSAFALQFLAPGLLAFSIVNILARAFYALGDTRTPMRISIVCLTLNVLFAWLLLKPLRQGGLGLANSASAFLNMGLLLYALRRKLGRLELAELRRTLAPILGAAFLAGVVAFTAETLWRRNLGYATFALRLGHVFVPMLLATAVYFGVSVFMGVGYAKDFFTLLRRKLKPAHTPGENLP